MKIIKHNSPAYQHLQILIDDEDYESVIAYKWHIAKGKNTVYACTCNVKLGGAQNGRKSTKYVSLQMHRMIIKAKKGEIVDHIDGNGLNNQKNNLRIVTNSQNMMNSMACRNSTSNYKGVCWSKAVKKWCAKIKYLGKDIHIGCFTNEKNAALAYDYWARTYYKEYAKLNFDDITINNEQYYGLFDSKIGTSQYKGVYFRKDINKWSVEIQYRKKKYRLGCYDEENDAAKAYNNFIIDNNLTNKYKLNRIK